LTIAHVVIEYNTLSDYKYDDKFVYFCKGNIAYANGSFFITENYDDTRDILFSEIIEVDVMIDKPVNQSGEIFSFMPSTLPNLLKFWSTYL